MTGFISLVRLLSTLPENCDLVSQETEHDAGMEAWGFELSLRLRPQPDLIGDLCCE